MNAKACSAENMMPELLSIAYPVRLAIRTETREKAKTLRMRPQ